MARATPAQDRAVHYVAGHPGCSMMECADSIGPSRGHGYATVHRAIAAGKIYAVERSRRGTFRLFVSDREATT